MDRRDDGSVGKSTAKEMIAAIQNAANPPRKVQKAQGSFNNEIGLSRTILETEERHDCAVLELGTNHPGEIGRLACVARPNVAVITCAAESHLEAFGSVANIALEKGAILDAQSPDSGHGGAERRRSALLRSEQACAGKHACSRLG